VPVPFIVTLPYSHVYGAEFIMSIIILEREMTAAEYARELEGFREHALEFGGP
jgi:hypothetical protein